MSFMAYVKIDFINKREREREELKNEGVVFSFLFFREGRFH